MRFFSIYKQIWSRLLFLLSIKNWGHLPFTERFRLSFIYKNNKAASIYNKIKVVFHLQKKIGSSSIYKILEVVFFSPKNVSYLGMGHISSTTEFTLNNSTQIKSKFKQKHVPMQYIIIMLQQYIYASVRIQLTLHSPALELWLWLSLAIYWHADNDARQLTHQDYGGFRKWKNSTCGTKIVLLYLCW